MNIQTLHVVQEAWRADDTGPGGHNENLDFTL